MTGIIFLRDNSIHTIKDLKNFLSQFDDDREVVFQMVDVDMLF